MADEGATSEHKTYAYVDVLRTLKRAINKGGQLYSAAALPLTPHALADV